MKKPFRFVVDRRTWLRGEGGIDSALLRGRDGKKCCIGFLALACGHQPEDILDVDTPANLQKRKGPLRRLVKDSCDTRRCERAIHTNDDTLMPDRVRERELRKLFRELSIEVTFRG